MKLRELLAENEQATNEIVDRVTDWYSWCVNNVPSYGGGFESIPESFTGKVGKISNNNMTVQIQIPGHKSYSKIYISLEKWFVKGVAQGKGYRMSKKALKSIDF